MKIIDKLKERFKKQTIWANLSDAIFVLLIIGVIVPYTRTEILGIGGRIRTYIWQPTVDLENAPTLSAADYDFEIADLQGNKINFSSLKGKVVFLNFWATWCPPCVGEMPDIEKLYVKFKDNPKVAFVIVSSESLSAIKPFIEKREYKMPVYMLVSSLPQAFGSNTIPVTFIISKTGKVAVNQVGAANWSGSKTTNLIEQLIEELQH